MANKNKKYKRSIEDAGKISDEQYYDIMEDVASRNYRDWGFSNEDSALLHALNDNSYNYKGYYNKYPNGDGNAKDHWTDEFKTVYHPTFSNESIYNGKKSQYNPNGINGGHWVNDGTIEIPYEPEYTFHPSLIQSIEKRTKKVNGGCTRYRKLENGGFVDFIFDKLKTIKNSIFGNNINSTNNTNNVKNTNNVMSKTRERLIKEGKLYEHKYKDITGVKHKYIKRNPNTSKTAQKSMELENSMYSSLDRRRRKTNYRTKNYDIPYGTKTIKIKPTDSTIPIEISVNALDSLAKNAGRANTSMQIAMGLPYQETNFGKVPLKNYGKLLGEYTARDLGNANYFKSFGSIPQEYLVRNFRYNQDLYKDKTDIIDLSIYPLEHAFNYFNEGNYNRGDKNHTRDVKNKGKAVLNETTGNYKNWWNNEGIKYYNEGIKERRKKLNNK